MTFRTLLLLTLVLCPAAARAADSCPSSDARACISARIFKDASSIDEPLSRDQVLRSLAASLTYDGQSDEAIALIGQISNPGTKAMTIRAIALTAITNGTPSAILFEKLKDAAEKISQPESLMLAKTYIAVAEDPSKIGTITDPIQKHEAVAALSEIQATRGEIDKAMQSVSQIDDAAYRNISYQNIAGILLKKNMYDSALKAAEAIDAPAKRAQTMLDVLKAQEGKMHATPKKVTATDMPEKIIP